jgi:subtilisin family serine protease
MKKILFALILIALFLAACGQAPIQFPKIDSHPEPVSYAGLNTYSEPPKYNPNSTDSWQMDLRSTDLSHLDLSQSRDDLMYATFDSKTTWPENMPADFDWQAIMETGKNPGLGVRSLHEQGITGEGIGIAIIDQALLVDHVEYKDRIRLYEEAEDVVGGWEQASMHGPAVASIAVGKTVGVAPAADLYFIATGDCGGAQSYEDFDFSCRAAAIRRIVEINKSLPRNRKIRVLSMAFGWGPTSKGYDEITAAVKEAKAAGIFVISSSIEETYGFKFHGLGRNPLANPDDAGSYLPGSWWAKDFYAGKYGESRLLVPMDSRTTANPNGYEDYVFFREGGWSWSIPYLAGTYALAAQVKPEITPEEFWKIALETGQTIEILHEGQAYQLGPILDPAALIAALKH